ISLSYDSACRRGEISQVEKYSFMEKDSNSTNLLRGKGNKHFRLFYMERTRAIAEKYLKERGEDDIDELFISTYGGSKSPLHYKRLMVRILILIQTVLDIVLSKTTIMALILTYKE